MADVIASKAATLKKVVQVLQDATGPLTTHDVARLSGVPFWTTDAMLELAYLGKNATFEAGVGWTFKEGGAPW